VAHVDTHVHVGVHRQLPDQYVAPPPPEYQERGNLRGWLLDNKARDQYVIRYADESEILWNDPAPDVSSPGLFSHALSVQQADSLHVMQ
jgi:hypothetical protein